MTLCSDGHMVHVACAFLAVFSSQVDTLCRGCACAAFMFVYELLFIQALNAFLAKGMIGEDMPVTCLTFAEWILTPSASAAVCFQWRRAAADKFRWGDAPWLVSVL